MRQIIPAVSTVFLIAGCAQLDWPDATAAAPEPSPEDAVEESDAAAAPVDVAAVSPVARTVDQFDTTTSAQKAEAVAEAAAGGGTELGMTIASLGAASEPGFWLKTPLVSAPAKGRVTYPATGKSVQVDLIPIDGPKTAGSRMSLAAMRLIDAPFTGLPEVQVFRTGG